MQVEGRIGGALAATQTGDGTLGTPFRQHREGHLVMQDAHARFQEAVTRGNVFAAQLQAAATFGTALTATAVTLTLYNPAGSGKNLVVLEGSASLVTVTAAGQVVYAVNDNPVAAAPSAVTALANFPKNLLLGSGTASVAKVYTGATLPAAPTAVRTLFTVAATAATSLAPVMIQDQVEGKMILAPGCCVTIQGITVAGSGLMGLVWEEVAI